MDDDVVPIVEELRRRLPKSTATGQGEEEPCAQDGEGGEENGEPHPNINLEKILGFNSMNLIIGWLLLEFNSHHNYFRT